MGIDPTALFIVQYPDPILRVRTEPVPEVTDQVRAIGKRMIELMFEAEGVGLAASQVGLAWRMFVAHVPEGDDRSLQDDPATATTTPQVYINPVLSDLGPPMVVGSEGCLSLPDINGDVLRASEITITATNLEGQEFTQRAAGLLARCWQHELDHLDGVLIIDRMTQMSRLKNRSTVRELERNASRR